MIKAKQTVEYMVKLQCEQAGIMEGSMDSMIHELYNNGWISKSTAEHYLQIYDIGTKAAKTAITVPTMQTRPTTCCPRRSTPLQTTGKPPTEDARPVAVPSSPETAAPVPGSPEAACSRLIFLKFVVPIVLVIILIVLIRVLTPKKPATEETSRTSDHNGNSRDHSPETEPESTASGSSYKTTTTLNVRKEPSTDADRIGKLDPGASVEYLRDHDDTWAVIKYNGQEAYVAKEFLTAE